MTAPQPVPFAIVPAGDGLPTHASNGTCRMAVLDGDGSMKLRRGIKHSMGKPVNETLLPVINEFAGFLLQNPGLTLDEARARLDAIASMLPSEKATNVEWVMGELNGVRVYYDGRDVIVTRLDLQL